MLYEGRCKICGKTVVMRKIDFKIKNKKCFHKSNKWTVPRIGGIYYKMKSRCYDNKCKDFKWYGLKGIEVCDDWMNDASKFEDWAINNGYADNLTIDRIDSEKGYYPDNCRWVTLENNSRYKSSTRVITINEISFSGRQWAELIGHGVNYINTMVRKSGISYTKHYILRSIINKAKRVA